MNSHRNGTNCETTAIRILQFAQSKLQLLYSYSPFRLFKEHTLLIAINPFIIFTLNKRAKAVVNISFKKRFDSLLKSLSIRDVRSGEADETDPHLKNCAKENEHKVYN